MYGILSRPVKVLWKFVMILIWELYRNATYILLEEHLGMTRRSELLAIEELP
jgi:hypothetical protein